jgi:hypothetical protein
LRSQIHARQDGQKKDGHMKKDRDRKPVGDHKFPHLVHLVLQDVYMFADSNTVFRYVEEPIIKKQMIIQGEGK